MKQNKRARTNGNIGGIRSKEMKGKNGEKESKAEKRNIYIYIRDPTRTKREHEQELGSPREP